MSANQGWTGRWLAEKMGKHSNISGTAILAPQHVRLVRKKHNPIVVAAVAEERLDATSLMPLLELDSATVDFVVNVPKESYIVGDALEVAERASVPIGGLGDLMRAVSLPDVRKYVSKEMTFVLRGLRQHTRIRDFQRVADRSFIIERDGLGDISVVFLNEYDLTADHVRTAYDRYGPYQILAITNPNGHPSSPAEEVAGTLGIEILKWGAFLGRLNRR